MKIWFLDLSKLVFFCKSKYNYIRKKNAILIHWFKRHPTHIFWWPKEGIWPNGGGWDLRQRWEGQGARERGLAWLRELHKTPMWGWWDPIGPIVFPWLNLLSSKNLTTQKVTQNFIILVLVPPIIFQGKGKKKGPILKRNQNTPSRPFFTSGVSNTLSDYVPKGTCLTQTLLHSKFVVLVLYNEIFMGEQFTVHTTYLPLEYLICFIGQIYGRGICWNFLFVSFKVYDKISIIK